jgi:hypothetical protein
VTEAFEVERVVDVDGKILSDQQDYVTQLIIANSTLGANMTGGPNGTEALINVTVSYNVIYLRDGVEVDPPGADRRLQEAPGALVALTRNDLSDELNMSSCNGTIIRIIVTFASKEVELHEDMINALRDAIFNLTHVLFGEQNQTAVQCSDNTEIVFGHNSTYYPPPSPPSQPPVVLGQVNLRPAVAYGSLGLLGICFLCIIPAGFIAWRRRCRTTQADATRILFSAIHQPKFLPPPKPPPKRSVSLAFGDRFEREALVPAHPGTVRRRGFAV